ncbi:activating transcription factor of chaperone isoform X2 [Harpegnathos saltator]|uniref:activating transcription factor of chaperone isoform X2 n=1 Tax=Harpegnathos saltator TaxID=610380 RepID=UPI00058D1244|nr:activating transcription factor of chaperone isoform X2 [Harpegnathos saltator]
MAALCFSEPFSAWMEQRTLIPIYEELPIPTEDESQTNEIGYQADILKPQQQDNTQSLLEEFETVLEDVEACHQIPPTSSLTPPQSPLPQQTRQQTATVNTQLLTALQPVRQPPLFISNESETVYNTIASSVENSYVNRAPPSDHWTAVENESFESLDRDELAVADEYVRSHTKDVQSPSSPCTSSGSSCTSAEDLVDDPDWSVESEKSKRKPSSSRHHLKPYQCSRPSIEDKKVRKKEQNKNAATRYRQKKKQEIKEIQCEEHQLTEINEKLKNDLADLQREIKFMKKIMRDVFKIHGILR